MYAKNSVSAGGEIQRTESQKKQKFFIQAIMIVAIKNFCFF